MTTRSQSSYSRTLPYRRPRSAAPSILADARWIGPHGIGRFAREVLGRLPSVELLGSGPRPLSLSDPMWLTSQVIARRPAVLFSPGFNPPPVCPVPFVFTIHDLIHVETVEASSLAKQLYYRCVVKPACRRAHRVLTVSEYSRMRILDWSGLPPERVVNVGNGVGQPFRADGPRYRPGFPYVLYVGNSRPHKNLDRLFDAFRRLARPGLRLLLVGVDAREATTDQVHVASDLPDEELASVYRGALLLVLPSLVEGFGLPALEAMACGTPVVVSRTAALAETTSGAGLFFDPLNVRDIARTMELVLDDTDLRVRMTAAGLQRAQSFSWDRVAAQVSAVLNEAARQEPRRLT